MTSKLPNTLQGVMNSYLTGSTFGTAPQAGYPASHGQQAPYGAPAVGQQTGWNHAPPGPYGAPAAAPAGYPGPQGGFAQYPAPQQYAQPQQQQQYMQPQQHHAAPTGYAGGSSVVVVSPQFCSPQQTILVMQEQFGTFRNDNFTITDATGRPYFTLAAAAMSMRDKRMLLDAYNQPLVQIEKKMLSLHNAWLLVQAGTGRKLAEVKPSMLSFTPSVKVYLNDGDKEPDFVIKGDFRSKKFTISQRLAGRNDIVIASVQRESRFANATSFLMSALTDAQKYFVTIEPGVDAAFVVALATLCDEIYNDQQGS